MDEALARAKLAAEGKRSRDLVSGLKPKKRELEAIFGSTLLPDDEYCKTCLYPKRPYMGHPCEFCYERGLSDARTLASWKEMMGGERAWALHTKEAYVETGYNAKAYRAALAYDYKQGSFLLHGPRGTGKTHLANIIKRPLVMRGLKVRTVFMQEELDAARNDIKKKDQTRDRVAALVAAPILSIEDLGVEKPSEWVVNEWYYKIIDGRYRASRPGLIITMNPSLEELEYYWSRFDPSGRVVSRLHEMCRGNIHSLVGEKDWRQA